MFTKHLIDKILITLDVGEATPLFILLSKDGIIHRKGNGDATANFPLIRGFSDQEHFEALLMTVNESIFDYAGVLKLPERHGRECRLTIIFQGKEDLDYSFRVVYGEQSQGPPVELAQILINAVKLTDPWYNEQLSTPRKDEKKWWEVWK